MKKEWLERDYGFGKGKKKECGCFEIRILGMWFVYFVWLDLNL